MEFIIWIIIVIAIVKHAKKKKNKDNNSSAYEKKKYRPHDVREQARKVQRELQNTEERQYGDKNLSVYDMNRKQKELKQRLQQKYGLQISTHLENNRTVRTSQVYEQAEAFSANRENTQKSNILSRASANVRENAHDALEHQMIQNLDGYCVGDIHALQSAADIRGESELMNEISDLIVMGYQAKLPYERDFIAEGEALLSRYEL